MFVPYMFNQLGSWRLRSLGQGYVDGYQLPQMKVVIVGLEDCLYSHSLGIESDRYVLTNRYSHRLCKLESMSIR